VSWDSTPRRVVTARSDAASVRYEFAADAITLSAKNATAGPRGSRCG